MGPIAAIMAKAESVPGITGAGLMSKLYFDRRPPTREVPSFAVLKDNGDTPVLDDAMFESGWDDDGDGTPSGQLLWMNLMFEGEFNSLAAAEVWIGYMDVAFYFNKDGISATNMVATPESTRRGQVKRTQEVAYDSAANLVFKVEYPLTVGFNYTPPQSASNAPAVVSGESVPYSGLSTVTSSS